MALAFTAGTPVRIGKRKVVVGSIAFDNSYPTGGELVTAANLGLSSQIDDVVIASGAKGYRIEYVKSTSKLKAMMPTFTRQILNPAQAARNLTGGAADVTVFQFGTDLYVVGMDSTVTTAIHSSVTPPSMSIEKRDADGSSNAVELAVVTYADHDAVGTVDSYMTGAGAVGGGATTSSRLASPYKVPAGYTLALKQKAALSNGGGEAGGVICHIWVAAVDGNVELYNTFDLSGLTAVRYMAFGW